MSKINKKYRANWYCGVFRVVGSNVNKYGTPNRDDGVWKIDMGQ